MQFGDSGQGLKSRIAGGDRQGDSLEVEFAPEGKVIAGDIGWLEANACDTTDSLSRGWTARRLKPGMPGWCTK